MKKTSSFRKTTQFLAPTRQPILSPGKYNIYPGFPVGSRKIALGFETLAATLQNSNSKIIILDGFGGVLWHHFIHQLDIEFNRLGVRVRWHDINQSLRSEAEINLLIEPFLGDDDPLFGTRFTGTLNDFFDKTKLLSLVPDSEVDINIVYGSGASLANWKGYLVYVDVPKNEVQFRSRAGSIKNLGAKISFSAEAMYKRFYFVDWPTLNRHRGKLLRQLNLFVDEQRPDEPSMMVADDVRKGLEMMAHNYVRVRPWFEPGPWGGQWIKQHIPNLSSDVPNYAWSFELISPENGIAFESDGILFELSFDFLMLNNSKEMVGDFADTFGYEFPIRYDFLDTFNGGNLSVQCHPNPEYCYRNFGETFTQDEAYYILDCKPGARVYLGFREDIRSTEFRKQLERSEKEGAKIDIDRYVNIEPARKHDLLLIPHGTIHCSGVDNLVLEISATPYIFTFKMYDWLRMNLEGKPRALNIERAFENLCFERKGDIIRSEFISHPVLLQQGTDWKLFHLPTHSKHFYDVHRFEFKTSVESSTNGSCHVMSLVEGTSVVLETANGMRQRFNYAETFIIPSSAGSYRIVNEAGGIAKVIKTFLKPSARPYAMPEGALSVHPDQPAQE